MQKSIFIMLNLAVLTFSPLAKAEDKEESNGNVKPMLVSEAEQAKLQNYAPFMRNMVMAAGHFGGSAHKSYTAAKVMRGGKQVIVLGGP